MDRAPSVYCFLLTLIFLRSTCYIDFIYILLNTVLSDIETMRSFHLLITNVEAEF